MESSSSYEAASSSSFRGQNQPMPASPLETPNPQAPHPGTAAPPQPPAQENLWVDLDHPLIPEANRFDELKGRRLLQNFLKRTEQDPDVLNAEVQTQVGVEVDLERGLRYWGYPGPAINQNRGKIRALIFYPRGRTERESTLLRYSEEMDMDFKSSTPYQLIEAAKGKHELPLYKPDDLFFP